MRIVVRVQESSEGKLIIEGGAEGQATLPEVLAAIGMMERLKTKLLHHAVPDEGVEK